MEANVLAEEHRVRQSRTAISTQVALARAFDHYLDPTDLDGSFPAYLRAAIATLSVGKEKSRRIAWDYYLEAREVAGYGAPLLDGAPETPVDLPSTSVSLAVVGPATVKRHIGEGASLADALRMGRARTLRYAKRSALSGGRQAVMQAVRSDTDALGWARISDGSPCAFCAMLTARGPVYKAETVRFRAHDGCGCGMRPFFIGEEDGGWNPTARRLNDLYYNPEVDEFGRPTTSWRERYEAARAAGDI